MQDMDKRDFQARYEDGLRSRREVLGAKTTDAAMAILDDFVRPLDELLNTYCFNDIWNRPGLSRHTRSLLNIAILTSLNRQAVLGVHLNAALDNGVSKDEIQEVLLQCAVYCGLPAAVDSFRLARKVFAERNA